MKRTFKAGWALFKIRALEGLQYRFSAFTGATVSTFWVLIEVAVFTVFYRYGDTGAGGAINGMTLAQAVSYRWVGELLFGFIASGVESGIRQKITSGDIGIELCRPLDLYWHWFARTAAGNTSTTVLRGGMTLASGILISLLGWRAIGLGLPYSPPHFALFLASLPGVVMFGASFCTLLAAVRLNVTWGDGPINLINVGGMILSGGFLPLQLWPDFLQDFLRFQPFASYYDLPARFYAGTAGMREGLLLMLVQWLWIAALILIGRGILRRKIKTIVVQGG